MEGERGIPKKNYSFEPQNQYFGENLSKKEVIISGFILLAYKHIQSIAEGL